MYGLIVTVANVRAIDSDDNLEGIRVMTRTMILLAAAAVVGLMAGPALAGHGAVKQHVAVGGGVPEANATISGTEEKTLVDKQSSGHYSVCKEGSHALTVSYDKSAMDVASGDCSAVEASKISAKGTDANAYSKAFIFNHTHDHHVGHAK